MTAVSYNASGNRTAIGYPSGVMASYGFDLADRQESLTIQVGSEPPQTVVSDAAYLPSGPLATLELGNGLVENRTYDGRYLPTGITVPGRLDWTTTTDGEGNILQVTDNLSPADNRTYGYQDVAYFLTQGDGPWGALGWSYDKIGNRLTETRDGNSSPQYPALFRESCASSCSRSSLCFGPTFTHDSPA